MWKPIALALFNERGLDVDVVLDLMIHDIDIVLHIIDSPLKELRASGIAVLTALPDIASVRMEFANGAVANLTASRISTKNMRKLRVFQENSYYVADYAERRAYAVYREEEADEDGYPQVSMEEMEIEERDALEAGDSHLPQSHQGVAASRRGRQRRQSRRWQWLWKYRPRLEDSCARRGIAKEADHRDLLECRRGIG